MLKVMFLSWCCSAHLTILLLSLKYSNKQRILGFGLVLPDSFLCELRHATRLLFLCELRHATRLFVLWAEACYQTPSPVSWGMLPDSLLCELRHATRLFVLWAEACYQTLCSVSWDMLPDSLLCELRHGKFLHVHIFSETITVAAT